MPKLMPEATEIRREAHFDNSAANRSDPGPTVEVRWRDQTWDEIMTGYFTYAQAEQDLKLGPPPVKPLGGGQYEATFRSPASPQRRKGSLSGRCLQRWDRTGHKMDGPDERGMFTTHPTLPAGEHQYRFVVDGEHWRSDPGNPRQVEFFNNSVVIQGQ